MTPPLRAIVVDDEPLAIERLSLLLGAHDDITVVGTAQDGPASLSLVADLAPDLCFLDIGMPAMDGVEVARACARADTRPQIVFVTAFDRFAVAAFEADAVDYLLKPVHPRRLRQAIDRAKRQLALSPPAATEPPDHLTEFWASDHNGLIRISAVDIDRITAERDYMRLHVGQRSWLINDSLSRLEKALDPARFVRLHRSVIVRSELIVAFQHDENGWIAQLKDGGTQRVGRSYADNARRLSGRGRPPKD